MASKFFTPGAERADKVGDLFATVAPQYDLINDLQSFGLHRLWKRQLVRLAEIRPGDHALDVCCGTGDVSFRLAEAGAHTVGFDFSEPMLAVARDRMTAAVESSAPGSIRFQQGDALHLPFKDAEFDIVTISYGLRNLADFDRGVAELLRVLKSGGRILILDFGKPDFAPWRWVYFQYLRRICPLFGSIFCDDGDTHGYIYDSLLAYPAQRGVHAALARSGCIEPEIVNLWGGMMSINVARKGR